MFEQRSLVIVCVWCMIYVPRGSRRESIEVCGPWHKACENVHNFIYLSAH